MRQYIADRDIRRMPFLSGYCLRVGRDPARHVSCYVPWWLAPFYLLVRGAVAAYWRSIIWLWAVGLCESHEAARFSWRAVSPFPWRGRYRERIRRELVSVPWSTPRCHHCGRMILDGGDAHGDGRCR